jgi:hypothetical protein
MEHRLDPVRHRDTAAVKISEVDARSGDFQPHLLILRDRVPAVIEACEGRVALDKGDDIVRFAQFIVTECCNAQVWKGARGNTGNTGTVER